MTTGRDALHAIDGQIAETRRMLRDTAAAAAGEARERAALDAREMDVYRALASLRLERIANGDGPGANPPANDRGSADASILADAEAAAARLVDAHDEHLAALADALDAAKDKLEAAEASRRALEAAHDAAVEAHDQAAAQTRTRLADDPAYAARASAVEAAGATVERARIKRDGAVETRAEKGAPFEADPLFMYLHDRRYATPAYRAAAPIAALDGWVADLIDYRNHRLNYARLIELPDRLADHVETLEEAAADAEAALEAMEREALRADGVESLRDRAGSIAADIDAADAAIADAESAHAEAASAHKAAAEGEVGPIAEARDLVADAIRAMPVPELRALASATTTLEDDRLVDALVTIKREKLEFEEARTAATRFADERTHALRALEDVRRKFKAARFDSPYSDFRGERMIETLLAEFLSSRIGVDELWRRIQRGHRARRRDWETDFGGDEWRDVFGLPEDWRRGGSGGGGPWTSGGSWGPRPGAPSSGRPPRPRVRRAPFPRGGFGGGGRGSSGGGGFRTGGGF